MNDENSLFVYGTLRFGDMRWKFLEPFVEDHGHPDTASGRLFDTGAGYPAALFEEAADVGRGPTIVGHRYRLVPARVATALRVLDEVESAVTGLYNRVRIVTGAGYEAWAYQYGLAVDDPALELTRISSGDWFEFRTRQAGG